MEPQSTHTLITMKDVCQSYPMAGHNLPVLRDVSLDIRRGQTCAILGTSGSGKSTLLNILGLLDLPTSVQFLFAGRNMIDATADERAQLRNREIGFVFPTVPVTVEYELTVDGRRLEPVVEVMKQFGLWVKSRQSVDSLCPAHLG